MSTLKILVASGSQRRASLNGLLARAAARGAVAEDVELTLLDWAAFPMPLYDPDLEKAQGLPAPVLAYKALLKAHHGLILATPEYNGSMTPLLKNAIDWASRPAPDETPMVCFKHKVVALLSTSTGSFGGVVGLAQVRTIYTRLGAFVIPEQYPVGEANKLFDEDGAIRDDKQRAIAESVGARLVSVLRAWPDRRP